MRQKLLACLLTGLITLWAMPAECSAAEMLLKIANVEKHVIDRYVSSGSSFFRRETDFFSELLRALESGVVQSPVLPNDLDHIHSDSLLKMEVREPDPAVLALFTDPGKLVGRQPAADKQAWDKFIIHCNETAGSQEPFLAEIGRGDAQVAFIAVQGEEGDLERWRISEVPPLPNDRTVAFSISKNYFMQQILQPNARAWLESLMPTTGSLGVVVLRESNPLETSEHVDSALIWVNPQAFSQSGSGMRKACLVIGWQPPKPQKLPSDERGFRWIWQ